MCSSNERMKSILAKLLRVLGKYSEFERPDRDKFVTIMWDNIELGENTFIN